MGVVYRARDTRLGRTVAIKLLRPEAVADPERTRRFLLEAKAASALTHPHIVTVHDIGEDPARGTWIAMELVDGESLRQRLERGRLDVKEALRIALDMARGLAAAHAAGIVHRDVKPGNVMITGSGIVKVLDFGLAKLVSPERAATDSVSPTLSSPAATRLGVLLGTPAYMSPEQAEGRPVDARSDVFSFGAVLYEMLTGKRPFDGASELSLLSSILRDTPPRVRRLRPEADPRLEELVDRCLAKDPAARPASAQALVPELEALLARDSAPSVGRLLRRPAWAAGLALVLAALGGLGFWAWRRGAQERWARREAMPEIQRLIDGDELVAAFRLARRARAPLAGDPEFEKLWKAVTIVPAAITTEPAGAEVLAKPYGEPDGEWERLGVSPVEGAFLPFTPHRVRITKPGFVPLEAVVVPQTPSRSDPRPREGRRGPGWSSSPPAARSTPAPPGRPPGVLARSPRALEPRVQGVRRRRRLPAARAVEARVPARRQADPVREAMKLFRDRTGRTEPGGRGVASPAASWTASGSGSASPPSRARSSPSRPTASGSPSPASLRWRRSSSPRLPPG